MIKKTHCFGIIFPIICLAFFSIGTLSFLKAQENQKIQPWDGSRTTAVHLIQLKDEFDQLVIPSEAYPLPYSTRYTCAPCHDYSIIQGGLHFGAITSSQHGRPGEPWIWVDTKTGTILPLSYRGWEGLRNPQDLELTAWDFTLLFGRHMTGGGISEPEDEETSPESRWNVSGKLEINCMGCHDASRVQSHSEWAKQVLRHNFRWAAVAASGLGEVGGMASRLPGTWDLYDGPNPDDTEWAIVPFVKYRPERFDSKHRVFFDIAPKIDDQRCLACHSVSRVGEKKYTAEEDVHSAAGLKCVDCHCNDVSHNMIRGYEGEAEDYQEPERTDFTCQGCHMGKELSQRGGPTQGRLGAPYPQHSGIPVVHFERLSCTVCHAGSLPLKDITRVRTSRANRLGIYGIAQWFTEWPHIIEPVFVRDNRGKLSPHRMMWPSFWARLEGDQILPLNPSDVEEAAGDILTVEQDVAEILKAIALYAEIEGIPVLILSGNVYEPNVDGLLDVKPYSGEKTESEIHWAVKTDGEISPLIPAFDPDAEEPDVDVGNRIQIVLEALATLSEMPGKSALVYKKAMYRVTEGYLKKLESPKESIETPEFVWLKGEETVPIVSEFQVRTLIEIVGYEQTLTEEQVELVLKVLSQRGMKQEIMWNYVYISGGLVFRLDDEGKLSASKHLAAEPVVWPLGHRVRPAQQALGINGCTDCHSEGSSFFFGQIRGSGPLETEKVEKRSAHSFMDLDKPYQKLFGLSFRVRPIFKAVLFVAAVIVGSILFLMFLLILGRYTGLLERRR
ncbi:MAG: cytochrome c3 family protein [Candidatus Aminicenantes bacterium]|nr:cytochrome c3 family protein [Candidatus Aminicenantes bacterium]